jgi:hypothetical protein
MTQIQGFIEPNRRPGELGIHSLDHFHFVVPDLSVAQHFYEEFGLDIRAKGNVLTINTHGHPHEWGTIGEGKKHSHMSFGAFEDDIDRFSKRLQTMGSNGSIRRRVSTRMGFGFMTTKEIWSRSKWPRSPRRTKRVNSRYASPVRASAGTVP